ncbi:MAG: sialate O-acetylesterase [bacterium]|nr:sialate O-acetylesterase [bacterium]
MHVNPAAASLWWSALASLLVSSAVGQKKPRADVVEVPAIAAGLCVSNVFQSNMVLQRGKPITVWGWAAPGEQITVEFAGESGAGRAAPDRSWRITLGALAASSVPRSMVVRGVAEVLTLENVLVGDVWVLGGQSNMEFELAKVENGNLEIVSANYPEIRILTVPYGAGLEPVRGFARLHEWSGWFGRHFRKGDWDVCTPAVARELSAIGFAFARRVHTASGVPIGVVDASRGGTTVETWTPLSRLRAMTSKVVRNKVSDWERRVAEWDAEQDLAQRVKKHQAWLARQSKAGKQVTEDRRAVPTDLRPGPIADHNHPGHCYAGMIAPLVGLAVKGVIFHQGYNNAFDGMPGVAFYREALPEMIRAWRDAFGDPALPFGILSLCTDGYPQTRDNYLEKMLDTGIFLRAAQYRTFLELQRAGDDNIGFASTFDLRRRWYHPQVKLPAGERIARWALATQYGLGRELVWQPPRVVAVDRRDGELVLRLDTAVSDPEDGAMVGFAIAGEDRRFQPAEVGYVAIGKDGRGRTRFDRKQLVLRSPLVPTPVHYRYAWGRNPLANVQVAGNKDLPLATQRSDDWGPADVPAGIFDEVVTGKMSRAQRNRVLRALREEDRRRRVAEAEAVLREFGPKGMGGTVGKD